MTGISESEVEEQALEWLSEMGWSVQYGPDIDAKGRMKERDNNEHVVLQVRIQYVESFLEPAL